MTALALLVVVLCTCAAHPALVQGEAPLAAHRLVKLSQGS